MKYVASSQLPVSVEDAFAYHERHGALQRLVPPWESVEVERTDNSLAVGSEVVLKTSVFGVPVRWVAQHTAYEPPRLFADTQLSGPFAKWCHDHRFEAVGEHSSLTDQIEFDVPFGAIGSLFGGKAALGKIESMFAYRHRVTRDDLTLQAEHPLGVKRVAISGSTGLVGKQLGSMLTLLGHEVIPIVRKQKHESPSEGKMIAAWSGEAAKLADTDVVVHLAGKSIASGRWSDETKRQIRESRVQKTRSLCESLAKLETKPEVLICASATGIYGSRGNEWLDESSSSGDDFLADVAREWENACQPAIDAGIRVVDARFRWVLSPKGGALQKMLTPAKFAGGSLGNGRQWWSWIALDDVLGAIYHAIAKSSLSGPVNFVSSDPITNAGFAKTLGQVIGRPAIFPAPAFMLRAALGEMADALLLSSARVKPTKLTESGYQFRFNDLTQFLKYSLGRERLESTE
ncbi:MAG: TIGR01777 family protein [Rhodopirellula sp.]|nr:TIGR01777 family protein [Rhodopirellula sp.]